MSLASLKARIDRLPQPSYRLQVGVAIAVVATQALIAMTGAIVRVTGSGLGCPTWPECFPGSMVPVEHPEYATLNQWIEYGNRLFTGLVGLIAGAALVLAYLHRPRDRRYLRLALAMPVGVVIQAIIGGLTVRMELLWWTVAVHLLASTVMVWLATLLVHAIPRDGRPAPAGTPLLYLPTGLLVGILLTGTMVTGAGPHGGDPDTPRLDLPVETLAHLHAAMLYTFLGSLVLIGLWLRGTTNPPWRRYRVLLAVALAQGAIGLVQFWTGVPELLVSLHVLGAMCVIIATASLWCGVRRTARETQPSVAEQPQSA
ncbi:COX15/CtaA family protein [Actinophytocola xanthii]|uniref:Cytochrome-c oxidase n=1 Tax=Actinophytocola xanthii TaxID=1912961 RepID=A0A1Q8CYR6_9PSEU|nr:COX15/CtaA family protein [Actinophytocola xanthii]OLF19494.1 cytochrome-c oxidase [Actinophytocola xanthii]